MRVGLREKKAIFKDSEESIRDETRKQLFVRNGYDINHLMGDIDDIQFAEQTISIYNPSQFDSEVQKYENESTDQISGMPGKSSRQKLQELKLKHLRSNSISEDMNEGEDDPDFESKGAQLRSPGVQILKDFQKIPQTNISAFSFQLRSGRTQGDQARQIEGLQNGENQKIQARELFYKHMNRAEVAFELKQQVEILNLDKEGKN